MNGDTTVYRYRPEVLDALSTFGVIPTERTPPSFVRDFLSDLYRWQLRQLRDRLLARAFAKQDYASLVVALRKRYFLLSVPLDAWTIEDGDGRRP
jgi:hypothetical protein